MQASLKINIEFPKKLDFLLGQKARYKVLYGSRGGTKSWGVARALLIRGIQQPGFRVLCTREVQSSMKESVHQLLKDQIKLMGLESFYRALDDEIRGPGGTLFMFKGLSDPESIKSLEGCDCCWIEEARVITKGSWQTLDPTVRKPGSEIWITFNPELENDFIYDFFVKGPAPPDAIVEKITWRDNPWFSDELRAQMEHMRGTNYDDYLWVWEGHCRTSLDGAVFADELRKLTKEERVCPVPYIPGRPVHTFWDLGYADHTSIWFAQVIGFRYHVIDYYENNRQLIDHYLQTLQQRGYYYGTDWLPHDAASNHPGVERTVERQMKDAGRAVKIVPKVSVADRINAARTIFPVCVFDVTKCSAGLDRLRAWRYGLNEKQGRWTRDPIHDTSSHAGDAFSYMGVALRGEVDKPKAKAPPSRQRDGAQGWMGL